MKQDPLFSIRDKKKRRVEERKKEIYRGKNLQWHSSETGKVFSNSICNAFILSPYWLFSHATHKIPRFLIIMIKCLEKENDLLGVKTRPRCTDCSRTYIQTTTTASAYPWNIDFL